tara:strand:- start:51 stop:344 length:294 start_codon:yes stop_codon:yes gene_type:complete
MAKELVVYKPKITAKKSRYNKKRIPKGNIFAKASKEQRFLGKTLPRMAWGAAKWAWRHPIASTAILMAPSIGKKLGQSKKFSFPEFRQFDKRGRKII